MLISKEEILHCPRCNEVMLKEPQDFYKCPKCGGEWWDDDAKLKQIENEKKNIERWEIYRRLMRGTFWEWCIGKSMYIPEISLVPVYVRKGGSRKSGRKRKKPVRKIFPSTKEV